MDRAHGTAVHGGRYGVMLWSGLVKRLSLRLRFRLSFYLFLFFDGRGASHDDAIKGGQTGPFRLLLSLSHCCTLNVLRKMYCTRRMLDRCVARLCPIIDSQEHSGHENVLQHVGKR